jgi:hypothetical protein
LSSTSSSIFSPSTATHSRTASLEMYLSLAVHDQPQPIWHSSSDMVSDDCEEQEDEAEDDEMVLDEPQKPSSRKLGMCALGKFSRQSLFENDAFSGCEWRFSNV